MSNAAAHMSAATRNLQLRQQRRATLRASLQLQTLNLQLAGTGSADGALSQAIVRPTLGRSVNLSNAGTSLLANPADLAQAFSEQLLPEIGRGQFRYAGGNTWFERIGGGGGGGGSADAVSSNHKGAPAGRFLNCATNQTAAALPLGVTPSTGDPDAEGLPEEVLRLEVVRRDKEREKLATQVNKVSTRVPE
jgi:hypothetical protein